MARARDVGLRAILMPTCARQARFAILAAATYGRLWPGHPPVWVLTDRGGEGHPRVLRAAEGHPRGPTGTDGVDDAPSWVEVVRRGIETLIVRGELAAADWVLLVIEDHTATDLVPEAPILEAVAHAAARGAPYVRVHLMNPKADLPDGETPGGVPMFRMRQDWTWYHSLHPAAWRVDHLRETLAIAAAQGATSPWAFERLPPRGRDHLACRAPWPSPWGGYLKSGRVDVQAVKRMRHPALAPLRRALLGLWLRQALGRRLGALVSRIRGRPTGA